MFILLTIIQNLHTTLNQ